MQQADKYGRNNTAVTSLLEIDPVYKLEEQQEIPTCIFCMDEMI